MLEIDVQEEGIVRGMENWSSANRREALGFQDNLKRLKKNVDDNGKDSSLEYINRIADILMIWKTL